MVKEIYHNINFMRFWFALAIIYGHCIEFLLSRGKTPYLQGLNINMSLSGATFVNSFFFISGFFLFKSYYISKDKTMFTFVKEKLFRLWPVTLFSFFILFVIGCFNTKDFFNMFFINSGIGLINYSGHNEVVWFVYALFWLSLFFYFLIKNLELKNLTFLCSVIAFLGFAGLEHSAWYYNGFVIFPILTTGMTRGLTFISLGILFSIFMTSYETSGFNKNNSLRFKLFITLIEACLLFNLFYNCCFHKPSIDTNAYTFLFVGIFFLFIIKKGFISKFFNYKLFGKIGDWAFSMYVLQFSIIEFCQEFLWGSNERVNLHMTVFLCVLIGAITYKYIEKPILHFLKAKYIEHRE